MDFSHHTDKSLTLEIARIGESLAKAALPGVQESIPALSSLTVFYDPLLITRERLAEELQALCAVESAIETPGRTWEIPVVYGGESGPDLENAASRAGLTPAEAVKLHSGRLYQVYMLGFLPGFAYMGDLPEPLRLPRRSTPRPRVPAGSVAIAAEMTAVYPLESPGGWHLIGSTPIVLWDMSRHDEPLLKPGDRVRFAPTSSGNAEKLRLKVEAGWRPSPVEGE